MEQFKSKMELRVRLSLVEAIKNYIEIETTKKSLGNIRNFAKLAKRWETKDCYNCE